MKKTLIATLILGAAAAFAMDEDGWASTYESLAAFDSKIIGYGNRPGYVKPIIDNLGNVLNSNWYISASVPKSLAIEFGLPISIIPIGDDDRNFNESVDILGQTITAENPTIFGEHGNPQQPDGRIYGNETLNDLGVFSYPYLQLGVSAFHARVVLRGMFLPPISELRKFNLFGFGLQYSFGHFFQYMLPAAAQPLDVSLVFGYNTSGIGYRPDNYDGELNLDVSTTNFSVVIGYKPISFFEVLMSLGYQSAEMKSSGHLVGNATLNGLPDYSRDYGKEISPDITVKGNNGFRFGIAIALQLGKTFHPVVGYDYAGKSSFTTNVIYFRQQFGEDKTPDEIAKEKGYVRGAKQEEAPVSEPASEPAEDTETESAEEVETDAADTAEEPAGEEETETSEEDF